MMVLRLPCVTPSVSHLLPRPNHRGVTCGHSLERITAALGAPYDLLEPGILVKQYPCCAFTHQAIDGMLARAHKHQFVAADVDAVECVLSQLAADMLIRPQPRTGLEGNF